LISKKKRFKGAKAGQGKTESVTSCDHPREGKKGGRKRIIPKKKWGSDSTKGKKKKKEGVFSERRRKREKTGLHGKKKKRRPST